MSIDQQIAANEKTFQEWFQRSWDAHHKESPSAADFKDVGDPRLTTRQKSYDYLDKRTVRVMIDFQSRPDDFVQLLQDYLINNALLLYQDSIRIANLPGSVSFYKDCGDQVGMVECHLSREGQIVTVAVGYQVYKRSISLRNDPAKINKPKNANLDNTLVKTSLKKSSLAIPKNLFKCIKRVLSWVVAGIICCSIGIALAIYEFEGFFGKALFLILFYSGIFLICFGFIYLGTIFGFLSMGISERFQAKNEASMHQDSDLSHTFFPVAYYSNEEVTAAQTQNKDHAAFLERIRSVIDRAVAFGESSHNQRT